jgi:hypothetical protein
MNFKFKTDKNSSMTFAAIGIFWQKKYKLFLFASLFISILLGAYVWRNTIYGSEWSDEKKQEYLGAQNKSITLRDGDFKKALDDFELRKNENDFNKINLKDIFAAY